jgi:hypothetical protein
VRNKFDIIAFDYNRQKKRDYYDLTKKQMGSIVKEVYYDMPELKK